MKRRNFLSVLAALPFVGFTLHASPKTYKRQVVVDYSRTEKDEFGYIYRRTVGDIQSGTEFVKQAEVKSNGDLRVESYEIELLHSGEVGVCRRDANRQPLITVKIIPRDMWFVNQWDGQGNLLRKITAKDFC
jgi:hypothetical protein